MNLEKLVRKNIKNLKPYSCARDEYKGREATFLDANENPFETLYNRYPDPYHLEIKSKLSKLKDINPENIILGNGSDEIIDLLIRSFCEPREDNMLVFSPGYGMYEVSAAINDVEVKKVDLLSNFLPDWDTMWKNINENTKLIFLCTPNNPTGRAIPLSDIEEVASRFEGLVLVDEAYVDFSQEKSAVSLIERYPNVVVMQTLSKAWGMAGLRLGMCFADTQIINVLAKVKAPYNIGSLTQSTVSTLLDNYDEFKAQCKELEEQRDYLLEELPKLGIFKAVYPSDANFILVISDKAKEIYDALAEKKIVVRLRNIPPVISGGIRISVGTKNDNKILLEGLRTL